MREEMNSESPVPALWGYVAALARHSHALALLALAACTPTLDWRAVRLPDTELVAELPCRPGRFQRDVVVAGVPLKLFMLSCEAGGVTYGVATADVGDPTRVDAVLMALTASAQAAVRSRDATVSPFELGGATPFHGNVSARLRGVRPDGEAIEETMRVFGRGTRIFQVSAIGSTLSDATAKPFEDGLHFDLENRVTDPS